MFDVKKNDNKEFQLYLTLFYLYSDCMLQQSKQSLRTYYVYEYVVINFIRDLLKLNRNNQLHSRKPRNSLVILLKPQPGGLEL